MKNSLKKVEYNNHFGVDWLATFEMCASDFRIMSYHLKTFNAYFFKTEFYTKTHEGYSDYVEAKVVASVDVLRVMCERLGVKHEHLTKGLQ